MAGFGTLHSGASGMIQRIFLSDIGKSPSGGEIHSHDDIAREGGREEVLTNRHCCQQSSINKSKEWESLDIERH